MHLEPIHITCITIFGIFFSYRAWEAYLWCKYPQQYQRKVVPLINFQYSKPTKSVKEKASSQSV